MHRPEWKLKSSWEIQVYQPGVTYRSTEDSKSTVSMLSPKVELITHAWCFLELPKWHVGRLPDQSFSGTSQIGQCPLPTVAVFYMAVRQTLMILLNFRNHPELVSCLFPESQWAFQQDRWNLYIQMWVVHNKYVRTMNLRSLETAQGIKPSHSNHVDMNLEPKPLGKNWTQCHVFVTPALGGFGDKVPCERPCQVGKKQRTTRDADFCIPCDPDENNHLYMWTQTHTCTYLHVRIHTYTHTLLLATWEV